MSNREIALNVIREMSDEKINAFLSLFVDEDMIARIEAQNIENDPNPPAFDTVEELPESVKLK
ncbi:MAG: hypothetical protein IIZ36_03390 [Ruminococcus sp.]|nr:hypothetical protein [Ruminococcus sp.]